MAEALTSHEQQAVEEFLEELRALEQPGVVLVSQSTAAKFLFARKFDVSRAIDLFQAYKNTRIKEGIFHIDPDEEPLRTELLSGKFTVLPGRDSNGAALALFTARLHRPDVTTHKAVLQAIIYQLDKAIESLQTQRDGLVFIYDMTNSTYGNFDYELCVKILNLLKGAFPARLKCVFIVSSPLWFRAPFAVLRLFVREKLRERVCTVRAHELAGHIPVESLPEHLGGSSPDSHIAWIQRCVNSPCPDLEGGGDCVGQLLSSYCLDHASDSAETTTGDGLNSNSCADNDNNANLHNHHRQQLERTSPSPPHSYWNGSALLGGGSGDTEVADAGDDECDCGDGGGGPNANRDGRGRLAPPPQSDTPPGTPVHPIDGGGGGGVSDGGGDLGSGGRGAEEEEGEGDNEAEEECEARVPPLPQKSTARPLGSHDSGPSPCVSVHMPEQDGMGVKELVAYVKRKGKRGIYQEYEEIRKEPPSGTFLCSKKPHNQMKNRYSDVLCLDQSRVKLSPLEEEDDEESSDYINASYMDGYKMTKAYIATQGPLPKTYGDFWRMVWEQMVLIIVMTTRVIERGRVKCGQYWPLEAGRDQEHENFLVRNVRIETFQDFKLSHLELCNTETGEYRDVAHYQYVSWPDFGVPKSASAMLDFRAQVRQHQEDAFQALAADWTGSPGGPPVVVHCSAGIGRTGTFCTLDICLSRLEDVGTVDVKQTVRRMRTQRAFSIQTWDQYYFCYTAIIEYAQRRGLLPPVQWSDSDLETDSE
ncbi:hypothetical protein GJAV_G00250640 [Gymnothorax javanicus]|nr:hypothetical protein GJAV_G00250640 [Gymnothorax javanicus]